MFEINNRNTRTIDASIVNYQQVSTGWIYKKNNRNKPNNVIFALELISDTKTMCIRTHNHDA